MCACICKSKAINVLRAVIKLNTGGFEKSSVHRGGKRTLPIVQHFEAPFVPL